LNYNVHKYPTLEFGRIGTVDFEKLAMALQRLAQGGLITAGTELEQYIRNAMDLPEAARTSESDSGESDDTDDPTDDPTLPVPKVQKVTQPVKVVSGEMSIFEDRLFGKFRQTQKTFHEDVWQMKREIEKAIRMKGA
jgi:BMFP domain-containing protein YqiC